MLSLRTGAVGRGLGVLTTGLQTRGSAFQFLKGACMYDVALPEQYPAKEGVFELPAPGLGKRVSGAGLGIRA